MSYYDDMEAPYELYEKWTKGQKMSHTPKKMSVLDCAEVMAKGDNFSCVANSARSRFSDVQGGRAVCSFCQTSVNRIADWLPNYHICEGCFDAASKIARHLEKLKRELARYQQAEMPKNPSFYNVHVFPEEPQGWDVVRKEDYDALRTRLARVTVERDEAKAAQEWIVSDLSDLVKWNHRVSVCPNHINEIVDGDCVVCAAESAERQCENMLIALNLGKRLSGESPPQTILRLIEAERRLAECERDAENWRDFVKQVEAAGAIQQSADSVIATMTGAVLKEPKP